MIGTFNLAFGIAVLSLLPQMTTASLAGGHKEGNGGDAIYCAPSQDNSYSGLYALDYIVAKIYNPNGILEYPTNAEALDALLTRMGWYSPDIARDFERFYESFQKQVIQGQGGRTDYYYWRKTDATLIDIEDEGLYADLPMNCKNPTTGRPNLRQAVARVQRHTQILFNYHAPTLKELASHADQLSWLAFHEFLWNYMDESANVKEANEFFHSEDFLKGEAGSITRYLETLRFFKKRKTFTRTHLLEFQEAIKAGEPSFTIVTEEARPFSEWVADEIADGIPMSDLLPGGMPDEPRKRLQWLVWSLNELQQGTNIDTEMQSHIDYAHVFPDVTKSQVLEAEKFYEHWRTRLAYAVEIYERILPVVTRATNFLKFNNRPDLPGAGGMISCEEVGAAAAAMAKILKEYPQGLDKHKYTKQYLDWWAYKLKLFQDAKGCRPVGRPVESTPQRVGIH